MFIRYMLKMSKLFHIAIWYLYFCGCNYDNGKTPEEPDISKLFSSNFVGGDTAQLDLSHPITNWTWNDPHVIKVGGQYWMYASATNSFIYPVKLYRLVSSDGITWSLNPAVPVVDAGASGEWDMGSVETPAVVFFNGQYHMFWTGYFHHPDDSLFQIKEMRIGHAVSTDGIHFNRDVLNPIVMPSGDDSDPNNDWYAFAVAEPGPVIFKKKIYLYFTALGADSELGNSLQVIGYVTSSDGITWSAPEIALKPDQKLYPRVNNWVGYSTPNAIVINNQIHLFFDVAHQPAGGNWLQQRLHHAYLPIGSTQWVQDSAAIRKAGDFNWAVDEIRSPSVFLDGLTLRLYFAGHELNGTPPEHFGIGMMSCELSSD